MEPTAAPIDVTSVTTTIEAYLPVISTVGLAVLGVVVAIKAFRWVRSSI